MISIDRNKQSVTIMFDDLLTSFQALADIFHGKDSLEDFTVDNANGDSFTLKIRVSKGGVAADGTKICGIVSEVKILKAIQNKGPFSFWLFVLPKYTFETFDRKFSAQFLGE